MDWEVLIIFTIILISSSFSERYEDISNDVKFDSCKRRSRYIVSLASLEDILIFAIKSFFDYHARASSIFAHILVALLNNCLEMMYSFSDSNCLYNAMIFKENWKLFVQWYFLSSIIL